MWSDIIHEFADSPSQSRVVRFLLENGFGVTEDGKISCNGIEVPATARLQRSNAPKSRMAG
jgi:predicted regulator of amino acid metabolism with ACT domain